MNASDIDKAVEAFQSTVHDYIEYGVDNDDAGRGILAALESLNLVSESDALAIKAKWLEAEEAEKERRRLAEETRVAALTPKQREREEAMRQMNSAFANAIARDWLRTLTIPSADAIYKTSYEAPIYKSGEVVQVPNLKPLN